MNEEPFDRAELLRYFKDESDELLQQIDADLLKLEPLATTSRSDPETINSLFRALHTIKGSAGMLELRDVSTFAHKLENACDLVRNGRLPISSVLIEILFEAAICSRRSSEPESTARRPPNSAGFRGTSRNRRTASLALGR